MGQPACLFLCTYSMIARNFEACIIIVLDILLTIFLRIWFVTHVLLLINEGYLIYIVYFMQIIQDKKDFLVEEDLSVVSFVADILHVKEPVSIYAYTYWRTTLQLRDLWEKVCKIKLFEDI